MRKVKTSSLEFNLIGYIGQATVIRYRLLFFFVFSSVTLLLECHYKLKFIHKDE